MLFSDLCTVFYKRVIRPLLFLFPPETAHHLVLGGLRFIGRIPGILALFRKLYGVHGTGLERTVAGIRFPNPVGLAAGLDKDAVAFEALGSLGFGFVEIGTVTPKPQPGNEKPRLFRLPADRALINRMGFNNEGVQAAVRRLKQRSGRVIIGGNIGKNKITPNEEAHNDYLVCFNELFPVVDYFVINISSPNTPGLRELQEKEPLIRLLQSIQKANRDTGHPKPVFLKIAPDLEPGQVDDIIRIACETALAGLIISNTTLSRDGLVSSKETVNAIGAGGLSGGPVFDKSTELLRYVHNKAGNQLALIASGGILSPANARAKLDAGASLVQLYTGFIYEGPGLIKNINKSILNN